jgi:hypothetical protein
MKDHPLCYVDTPMKYPYENSLSTDGAPSEIAPAAFHPHDQNILTKARIKKATKTPPGGGPQWLAEEIRVQKQQLEMESLVALYELRR